MVRATYCRLAVLLAALVCGTLASACERSIKKHAPRVTAERPKTPVDDFTLCDPDHVMGIRYAPMSEHQQLDIYMPKHAKGRLPLVVWVHGGSWAGGSRYSVGQWALRLVCRGYVVAAVDYRLSWEAPFRAQLVDMKNAVRFLKMNAWRYHIDPTRVGLWGVSAGAHLAALTGLTGHFRDANRSDLDKFSARVQAVVHWWGPTDLVAMRNWWPTRCGKNHRNPRAPDSAESLLIGCPLDQCLDAARAASPVQYVSRKAPPFLIMFGQNDCTVPAQQGKILRNRLRRYAIEAKLHILPKGTHGGEQWSSESNLATVDRFLDNHLKK